MEKFKVEESTFFLFKNSRRDSSSTLKSSLATIHPMSIRSSLPPLSTVVPPTTKTPHALKESGTLVGTSMIIGVSLCVFVLPSRSNGSLWTRLNLRGMLLSSPTMKLPRDSPLNRFYFSYPSFFFFYTHFSLQDLRKKTRVPLNVFNISKKKK